MAAVATPEAPKVQWITRTHAAQLLGGRMYLPPKLARAGKLTELRIPGSAPRYNRAEVEAFVEAHTRAATDPPPEEQK